MKAGWHFLLFFCSFFMFEKQASRRMIPRNMLLYGNIGRSLRTISVYMDTLRAHTHTHMLFTSWIKLAASCTTHWSFLTKCKITVMMPLLFGNVSGYSTWLALLFFIYSLYFQDYLVAYGFIFILFNFFLFAFLLLQHFKETGAEV